MIKKHSLYFSPLILSILSAVLLSLPWLGFSGFFSLIAWIPLLVIRRNLQAHNKKGFLWWVTLTIMLWHVFSCYWVSFATLLAAPAVPIVCWSMLWGGWVAFHFIDKLGNRALSYTALVTGWIVGEWWLSSGDFGFGWLMLGSAWADQPWAVQWYSILGSYGGSLWIIVSNIFIYEAIFNKKKRIAAAMVTLLPIAISTVMYFTHSDDNSGKIDVAIIQPNVDAYAKYSGRSAQEQTQNIIALAKSAPESSELYVAPETALISLVDSRRLNKNKDIESIQRFLQGKAADAMFIIGATHYDGVEFYNSVLYIKKNRVEIYNKRKLVFGVEVIPEWIESALGMIDLGGNFGSLGRDSAAKVSSIGDTKVGAVVCYESIYGELMTEWVNLGANLMAVITNDGWWRDTHGYRQHFSYSRLRAVELGRTVVRSANTGISGVINSRGDVVDSMGWDKRGVISARVELSGGVTPYVKWGDIVLRISMLVFGLSLLYGLALKYRKKADLQ